MIIYLDRWSTFGHYNRIGKLNRAQFSLEPLPILDGIIMDNQVSTACIRRGPFQARCADPDCVECDGLFVDLTYLWSTNVPPTLARAVLKILPLKSRAKKAETE